VSPLRNLGVRPYFQENERVDDSETGLLIVSDEPISLLQRSKMTEYAVF
jgi:hypothetical protein